MRPVEAIYGQIIAINCIRKLYEEKVQVIFILIMKLQKIINLQKLPFI